MNQPVDSDLILRQVRATVKEAGTWDWTSHKFQRDLTRILRTAIPKPAAPTDADIDRLTDGMCERLDADESTAYAEVDEEQRESMRFFAALALTTLHEMG